VGFSTKAGLPPGASDGGRDPRTGRLTLDGPEGLIERQHACVRLAQTRCYTGIRDAIPSGAPDPVPTTEAPQIMDLIELGFRRFAEGRVVAIGALD